MNKVFGGADNVRTIIFPNIVGTVRQEISRSVKSLESSLLNVGLEVFGTDERKRLEETLRRFRGK